MRRGHVPPGGARELQVRLERDLVRQGEHDAELVTGLLYFSLIFEYHRILNYYFSCGKLLSTW